MRAFWNWAEHRNVHLFSTKSNRPYTHTPWTHGDVLLFGPESRGLPEDLITTHGAWTIPMVGPIRSLNLANAVAVVAYGALQQLEPNRF